MSDTDTTTFTAGLIVGVVLGFLVVATIFLTSGAHPLSHWACLTWHHVSNGYTQLVYHGKQVWQNVVVTACK